MKDKDISFTSEEIRELRHLVKSEIGKIETGRSIYGDSYDNEYMKNLFKEIFEKLSK